MPTKQITIANITDVRKDKHDKSYRLIYTPEEWTIDENGTPTLLKSEQHFCYDEPIFDKLKPGVVINIISN